LADRRKEGKRKGKRSKLFHDKYGVSLFDCVFIDEGDLLRAEQDHLIPGQIRKRSWQAAWHLACPRTWALTGTPINNNATGLLSLFELGRCDGWLPERVLKLTENESAVPLSFMQKVRRLNWAVPAQATVEAMRTLQKACCLRRTIDSQVIRSQNAQSGRPLPICKYVDMPVTVGEDEDIYMSTVETNTTHALRNWLRMDSGERYDAWSNVWSGMTQARRVASLNPRIGLQKKGTADMEDFVAYPLSEKEKYIIRICQAAQARGEQVVIATLFIECNVRLVASLKRYQLEAVRFDGQVSQKDRQENMDRFREGDADCLVMLMFAGGRGLNLQNANNLIITSPWWNPVVLDQTRRRVWRVGSPHKVVTIYNVFYDITVEQWMLQTRIKTKVELAAAVMNEENMYGGEEAISTARSKAKLSSTLEEERDGMWDFLGFLRAVGDLLRPAFFVFGLAPRRPRRTTKL
jgi:SNF2 family DNA or RNA helicase